MLENVYESDPILWEQSIPKSLFIGAFMDLCLNKFNIIRYYWYFIFK